MNRYDLVLHVDRADDSLALALHNYMNYFDALKDKSFLAVLVVNASGTTLLKADNGLIADALERAIALGLSVRACGNALKSNGIRPDELHPQCKVVPAGIVEIVRLQNDGFAYIKP